MEEKSIDYMNVIPLVDIMLVLLTIVLMASTFVASGAIPVQLPKSSQQQNQEAMKAVVVSIDSRGTVYFGSQPTTLSGLRGHLGDINRATAVAVRADRTVPVQMCVDVLDLLTESGFKRVSLSTERKQP